MRPAGVQDTATPPDTGQVLRLNAASAAHLTARIREVWGLAWDLIHVAYAGRAWEALGYRSWNDYVEREFGSLAVHVPRDDRPMVAVQLRCTGMSTRAIARVLGVDPKTVRNDLWTAPSGGENSPAQQPNVIVGADGKPYPASHDLGWPSDEPPSVTDEAATEPCPDCGDWHDLAADCPSVLAAAGLGPTGGAGGPVSFEYGEAVYGTPDDDLKASCRPPRPDARGPRDNQKRNTLRATHAASAFETRKIIGSLASTAARLQRAKSGVARLAELAGSLPAQRRRETADTPTRLRELASTLSAAAVAMPALAGELRATAAAWERGSP